MPDPVLSLLDQLGAALIEERRGFTTALEVEASARAEAERSSRELGTELSACIRDLEACRATQPTPPPPTPARSVGTYTVRHPDNKPAYVSFGAVFLPGEFNPATQHLFEGGLTASVQPLAFYPDGSVRHAMVATAASSGPLELFVGNGIDERPALSLPRCVLTIDGELLALHERFHFVSADVAVLHCEWILPNKAAGELTVRAYPDGTRHFCLTAENSLALPTPNVTLDLAWSLKVDGEFIAFAAFGDLRYRQRRKYRHAGSSSVLPDRVRWQKAGALPPYAALKATPEEKVIASIYTNSAKPVGPLREKMGWQGGSLDRGLLPAWDRLYLGTGDPRLWEVVFWAADGMDVFPVHFRDPKTGEIWRITDHPTSTIINPKDGVTLADRLYVIDPQDTAFQLPYEPDHEHHPEPNHLAYLMGCWPEDYTEMLHRSWWMLLAMNHRGGYRDGAKGLFAKGLQTCRAQAWTFRVLACARWCAPFYQQKDADLLQTILERNLDYYLESVVPASPLGFRGRNYDQLASYKAAGIQDLECHVRQWQEDMFGAFLLWLDTMGILPHEKVARFGAWLAGGAVGRIQNLGGLKSPDVSGYDLPGRLNTIPPSWLPDWAAVKARLRVQAADIVRPQDANHYQAIMTADLAAAAHFGIPGAAELFTAARIWTWEGFSREYANEPTWVIEPPTAS